MQSQKHIRCKITEQNKIEHIREEIKSDLKSPNVKGRSIGAVFQTCSLLQMWKKVLGKPSLKA
jgi:hypothetical protein